jgi:hypothetical protein
MSKNILNILSVKTNNSFLFLFFLDDGRGNLEKLSLKHKKGPHPNIQCSGK